MINTGFLQPTSSKVLFLYDTNVTLLYLFVVSSEGLALRAINLAYAH